MHNKVHSCKHIYDSDLGLDQFDHINRILTLSVITISDCHSLVIFRDRHFKAFQIVLLSVLFKMSLI